MSILKLKKISKLLRGDKEFIFIFNAGVKRIVRNLRFDLGFNSEKAFEIVMRDVWVILGCELRMT